MPNELYNIRGKLFIDDLVENKGKELKKVLKDIGINNTSNYYSIGTQPDRNFTIKHVNNLVKKYGADPACFFVKSHINMYYNQEPKTLKAILKQAIQMID